MYLLHVAQHILPAVKHSSPLLRVQLVDKVRRVVFIRVLIPSGKIEFSNLFSSPPLFLIQ